MWKQKIFSRKFLLVLAALGAVWASPMPVEVKVGRTVYLVIAYVAAEGAGDAAERFGNGKRKPEEPVKKPKK